MKKNVFVYNHFKFLLQNQQRGTINNINSQINSAPIQVSSNGHYLQIADGKPFFYLGDTA
jgi:hypothetical protein